MRAVPTGDLGFGSTALLGWEAIDADDFVLCRYGMVAHVEQMDRGHWWFAISEEGARHDLYNTADNLAAVKLTTGKAAKAAAECCLELLRTVKPNAQANRKTGQHGTENE